MGYGDMAHVQKLQNVRHQYLGLQMDLWEDLERPWINIIDYIYIVDFCETGVMFEPGS